MLRDRYDPMNLFELVPSLSMQMDPILAQIDTLLDEDRLFQSVKADLAQRFPHTRSTGRPSTPVEVILRLLVIKHLYAWSYEQTEQFVADSLVLRQFCRIYAQRVPDDTTLLRWAGLIQPQTLHALLDHLVKLARALKVTRGRKLRLDATVVETNIHHPSDSTLLYDGVRVVGRLLRRAKAMVRQVMPRGLFRNRRRSAKGAVRTIMKAARERGAAAEAKMRTAYERLLEVAQATVRQARQVGKLLKAEAQAAAQQLSGTLEQFVSGLELCIDQATRRVLHGEVVPASDSRMSLFEPHTAIIRKGKLDRPVEFGSVVWLNEVEGGLISAYAILEGNPREETLLVPALGAVSRSMGQGKRDLKCERRRERRGMRNGVLRQPLKIRPRAWIFLVS